MKLRCNQHACMKQSLLHRRGSAMLVVIMLSAFTMGLWAVHFRSTDDAIETSAHHRNAPFFDGRITKAVAYAGHLLENDKPEKSSYRFLFTGQDERGRFFTTVEVRKRSNGRFEVSARPAVSRELRRLPRNPVSFK